MSLPVVAGAAEGFAELAAGSPIVEPRPLGICDCAWTRPPARRKAAASVVAVVFMKGSFLAACAAPIKTRAPQQPWHATAAARESSARFTSGIRSSCSFGRFARARLTVAGHAEMHLVPLTNRNRGRSRSGFEGRFLGVVFAPRIAVVKHGPVLANGHDGVLRKAHVAMPLCFAPRRNQREQGW